MTANKDLIDKEFGLLQRKVELPEDLVVLDEVTRTMGDKIEVIRIEKHIISCRSAFNIKEECMRFNINERVIKTMENYSVSITIYEEDSVKVERTITFKQDAPIQFNNACKLSEDHKHLCTYLYQGENGEVFWFSNRENDLLLNFFPADTEDLIELEIEDVELRSHILDERYVAPTKSNKFLNYTTPVPRMFTIGD